MAKGRSRRFGQDTSHDSDADFFPLIDEIRLLLAENRRLTGPSYVMRRGTEQRDRLRDESPPGIHREPLHSSSVGLESVPNVGLKQYSLDRERNLRVRFKAISWKIEPLDSPIEFIQWHRQRQCRSSGRRGRCGARSLPPCNSSQLGGKNISP